MTLMVPKDGILSTETVHRRIRHRQTLFLGRACLADGAALVVVICAHTACFAAARAGVDELALGTRRAKPRVGLARVPLLAGLRTVRGAGTKPVSGALHTGCERSAIGVLATSAVVASGGGSGCGRLAHTAGMAGSGALR